MRASWLCSLWPDMRSLRFQRLPFGRDVAFDPGGATASCIAMPHILPSTVPSVSASAKLLLSWLNPPPHPITVYASHPPLPTTTQHSLPGSALPPYRGRSFTGRNASASPDAPELTVRIHSPPAKSQANLPRLRKLTLLFQCARRRSLRWRERPTWFQRSWRAADTTARSGPKAAPSIRFLTNTLAGLASHG